MLPFTTLPMDVAQQAYVQLRAEERARTGNDVTAEESEVNPQLRYDLIWQGGNSHFVAIYQPRLVLTQTFDRNLPAPTVVNPETINTTDPNDTPLSALQNGGLGFEHVGRRWRLALYQFAAYGPVTTTSLLVQAPWAGDGLPADPNPIIPSTVAARFTLLFAQTQAFLPIRTSKRVAITPGFVYNAFGGANSESRAAMALTAGPGANVTVEVAATKMDRLTSVVGAGLVTTSFEGDRTGATIYRAEATQSWRHWYDEHLATEVLAGGSIGGDEISGVAAYSTAQAAMLYDTWPAVRLPPGAPPQGGPEGHGDRVQAALVAKAQPWLDLFSGELEERAVGTAAVNYTTGRTMFRTQVSAARVFNTPRSVAKYLIFQAEGGIRYAFTKTFSADVGARFGYQDFSNAIRFNTLDQVTVFGGISWTPLPARF
jgi:hypothetical protein